MTCARPHSPVGLFQDEHGPVRDAHLAAQGSDAYTLHRYCPPACHLKDTLHDLKEFTDRAKSTAELWVDVHAEAKTCTRIRTLVRRVREAIANLPTAHECAPPPIPRTPAPSEGLEPLDDHAQAANVALGDAEPAEPCPGAAPSSALTDAASDADAEVSSSPSESPAATAVTVICEPHSPSPSAVVVEMADETGSALFAAAARHTSAAGLAASQVSPSEAAAQAGDARSLGTACGASYAAAAPPGAPPVPASAQMAPPLPQHAAPQVTDRKRLRETRDTPAAPLSAKAASAATPPLPPATTQPRRVGRSRVKDTRRRPYRSAASGQTRASPRPTAKATRQPKKSRGEFHTGGYPFTRCSSP